MNPPPFPRSVALWKWLGRLASFPPPGVWRDLAALSPLVLLHWVAGFMRWNLFYGDTAREMLIPRRILAGDFPFLDFELIYGPLSYHVTAFFLRLFGNHLLVDRAINGALLVLTLWVLLEVAAKLGLTQGWRKVLGATWLTLFAFPGAGFVLFGFMMPHCQAGIIQPFLQLAAASCLIAAIQRGSASRLLLLGLITGLAPLACRLDMAPGVFILGLLALSTPWLIPSGRSLGGRIALTAGVLAMLLLPVGLWFSLGSLVMPLHEFLSRLGEIRHFLNSSTDPFVWKAFFRAFLYGLGGIVAFTLVARRHPQPSAWFAILAVAGTGVWVVAWQIGTLADQHYLLILSAGFLVTLGSCLALIRRPRDTELLLQAALGAAACACAVRSFASAYSLYSLLYSGTLLLVVFFAGLQRGLGNLLPPGKPGQVSRYLAGVWLAGLAMLNVTTLRDYASQDFRVRTEWGDMWMKSGPHAVFWSEAAKWIRAHSLPMERIYSYSPNNAFYALANRLPAEYDQDGTRWKSHPVDGVLVSFAEERMVSRLDRCHVRWIIQDNATYSVHGIGFTRKLFLAGKLRNADLWFGRDEAVLLSNWIAGHCHEVKHWGGPLEPAALHYGLSILERRPAP